MRNAPSPFSGDFPFHLLDLWLLYFRQNFLPLTFQQIAPVWTAGSSLDFPELLGLLFMSPRSLLWLWVRREAHSAFSGVPPAELSSSPAPVLRARHLSGP